MKSGVAVAIVPEAKPILYEINAAIDGHAQSLSRLCSEVQKHTHTHTHSKDLKGTPDRDSEQQLLLESLN